jgi:hypothetical protein
LQKYTIIIISILVSGCSATSKLASKVADITSADVIYTDDIKEMNITNNDFTIIKAKINIETDGNRQKMIGTVKYKIPDNLLVSFRSQAGIEAARIYINTDTILINDRINKKLYHGSQSYLYNKYGISTKILPVIMGDYIREIYDNERISCRNNKGSIKEIVDKKEIIYEINCGKRKISRIKIFDSVSKEGIIMEFEKFRNVGDLYFAQNIKISDIENKTRITIDIEKIDKNVEGSIRFIPGKNYEDVLLR